MEEPRNQVGALIRRLRKERGKTQEELAALLACPQNYVSRLETGAVSATAETTARIAEVLHLDHITAQQLRGLAIIHRAVSIRDTNALESIQRGVAVFEEAASLVEEVSTFCIPGLLQTRDYARAIMLTAQCGAAEADAAATSRMNRQGVLAQESKTFSFLLVEASLCSRVCPPLVMAQQLDHIEAVAQSSNITLYFLGSSKPCRRLPVATFAIYDQLIVTVEGYLETSAYCAPDLVRSYTEIRNDLCAAANSGEAAISDIRRAAKRIWRL